VDLDLDGIGDEDADTNDDNEIQVSEVEAILGLIVNNKNIDSLEGIASFTNLVLLLCNFNDLISLDISQNEKI